MPRILELTEPGCCPRPIWSPDSALLAFVDRPSPDHPAGYYTVPALGGEKELLLDRVGVLSADWSLVSYPEDGQAIVERLADRMRWVIPSDGRAILFSHSGDYVAWQEGSMSVANQDRRRQVIWMARQDGTEARTVVATVGGELIGWASEDAALLVSGRLDPEGPEGIWRVPTESGQGEVLLWEGKMPRGMLVSPGGGWLAFYAAFSEEATEDGLRVVRTDVPEERRLSAFGSYRWRGEGELVIIPLEPSSPTIALWEVNIQTGESRRLIESPWEKLAIANNDWQPSPDGSRIVFLSASDCSLRVLELH